MSTGRIIQHLKFLDNLADKYYYNSNKIDKAISIERKKIIIVKKLYKKDKSQWTELYIRVLKNLALSYHIKGEFHKSIKLEKKVDNILKSENASQLVLLSALYIKIGDIKNTIKYSKKAIKLYKQDVSKNIKDCNYPLSILVIAYRKDNQLEKAKKTGKELYKIQDRYFNDSAEMIEDIKDNFLNYRYVSDRLKSDPKFIQSAILANGSVLQYLDDTIKVDKKMVLCAVSSNHTSIQYANDNLQNDREFILEAIGINPLVFILLKEKFKYDDEFVNEAMKISSGYIFPYVSKRLKAYKKLENLYEGMVCQDKMN